LAAAQVLAYLELLLRIQLAVEELVEALLAFLATVHRP
jgi:hypothetical protein